jgi:HD superfamily phosphohydrolase
MSKTQRIWDPIHNMIVFEDDLDKAVWKLLNTPEVQRLRRIKQLGVSEFVFPSATHTRFAHSVGVFHNARQLVRLFDREIKRGNIVGAYDEGRARISVMAALLHDVGHGPFSHAFEEARKAIAAARAPGKIAIRKHEFFSAEMIRSKASEIPSILSSVDVSAEDVAGLIQKDVPADKIVSAIKAMQSRTAMVLELAATIHWLAFVERFDNWRDELIKRKGVKTEQGRSEDAFRLLTELNIAPIQ